MQQLHITAPAPAGPKHDISMPGHDPLFTSGLAAGTTYRCSLAMVYCSMVHFLIMGVFR
jgi:hypothetical protein